MSTPITPDLVAFAGLMHEVGNEEEPHWYIRHDSGHTEAEVQQWAEHQNKREQSLRAKYPEEAKDRPERVYTAVKVTMHVEAMGVASEREQSDGPADG